MSTFSGHNYLKDKIETELFRNKVFTETKWVKEREITGRLRLLIVSLLNPKLSSNFCFDLRMPKLRKLLFHCTWDKKALKCPTNKWDYFNSLEPENGQKTA